MDVLLVLPLILMVSVALALPALAQGTYTASDSGKTIYVNSGDAFTVKLDENPSTGYSWNLTVGDGLKVINDDYVSASTGLIGSGGYHIWTIQATKAGTYKVQGIYKRPWEPLTGSEKKYSLTVKVTAPSAGTGLPSGITFPKMPTLNDIMPKFSFDLSSIFSQFPKF
ncbi:MAG TPA: protease inhibitor I42 family protein [Methanocella sp.]|nr:protease inhibitor I42 family protein [Methanocella sp.]